MRTTIDRIEGDGLTRIYKGELRGLVVDELDLVGFESKNKVVIENCIIQNLGIHSCWFREGLVFKNNIVLSPVDYQMGGHNFKPIEFSGNVFVGFANFFDCQFTGELIFSNNVLEKGSNLLGNRDKGFSNSFDKGIVAEMNAGKIDFDDD